MEQVTGNRLKACPFCGGENAVLFEPGQIHCLSCGAAGPDFNITQMEAVRAWNQRVDLRERTEFAEIVERLKQRGVIPQTFDASMLDSVTEVSNG